MNVKAKPIFLSFQYWATLARVFKPSVELERLALPLVQTKHHNSWKWSFANWKSKPDSIWVLVVEVSVSIESTDILHNLLFQRYRYGTSWAATLLAEDINSTSSLEIQDNISGSAFKNLSEWKYSWKTEVDGSLNKRPLFTNN